MPDLLIDSKPRQSGMLPGTTELQRRMELQNRRRTFRAWPLLPVLPLPPAVGPQPGPVVEWPQDTSIQREDEWADEEALAQDFAPVCEASLGADGLGQRNTERRGQVLKTCLLVSVALHLCCAGFFIAMPAPETVEIAGGGAVSVMLVGEQAFDSLSAGGAEGDEATAPVEQSPVEQVKVAETADQSVEATTTRQTLDPVDVENALPRERVEEPVNEPTQTVASAPTEPADAMPTQEPVAQAVAQIQVELPTESLTVTEANAIDPTAVAESGELQPVPQAAVMEAQAHESAEVLPVKPLETAEPKDQPDKKRPDKKAPSHKKVEKPKADDRKAAARKQEEIDTQARAAPTRNRKGEAGEGTANAQRGASAQADSAGRSEPGNAATSNYPGKVAAKLRRALKYPRSAVSSSSGEAQVAFTVLSDGSATGIRIVSSSGSPILDQAAMEAVRRASPFPPIPTEAGRRQWPFAVPVLFKR